MTPIKVIYWDRVEVAFTRSSFCGSNACVEVGWVTSTASSGGACVEVNCSDDHTQILVRDSKDPDGPVLTFTGKEWDAFLSGAKAGEFDRPPA